MPFQKLYLKYFILSHLPWIIFSLFLILLSPSLIYGQQTKFDSIYYHTAVNVVGTDSDKALHIADSLYSYTSEKVNKIRSLMLSADIYAKKGQINKSIDYALRANTIAEDSNNFDWVARISGFLSTQYRSSGLKNSGLKFLSKGLIASQKMTNENTSNLFQAIAYQEKAYYQMDDKRFEEAIESLNRADDFLHKLKTDNSKFFLLATNEELLGKNNFSLSNYSTTKKHYFEGLVYLKKSSAEESPLKGFIYNGLGKVFFKEKNYDEAHNYFLKAIEIAEKADNANLKIEAYKELCDYYDIVKNHDQYKKYNDLYNQALHTQIEENRQSADKIVTSVTKEAQESSNNKKRYLYLLAVIIIGLTFFFTLYGIRKKREKEKFLRIVKTLREQSLRSNLVNISNISYKKTEIDSTDKHASIKISPEVEQLLIEKLDKFELGNKFTDNNISLSSLSTLLDTNSKYLSYVINHHKGRDFNTYINELRVFFIIDKIENDPVYAQYKISYLAEEAGFSSHSKFSSVFKSVLGLSPSVYLEQYNSAQEEK